MVVATLYLHSFSQIVSEVNSGVSLSLLEMLRLESSESLAHHSIDLNFKV